MSEFFPESDTTFPTKNDFAGIPFKHSRRVLAFVPSKHSGRYVCVTYWANSFVGESDVESQEPRMVFDCNVAPINVTRDVDTDVHILHSRYRIYERATIDGSISASRPLIDGSFLCTAGHGCIRPLAVVTSTGMSQHDALQLWLKILSIPEYQVTRICAEWTSTFELWKFVLEFEDYIMRAYYRALANCEEERLGAFVWAYEAFLALKTVTLQHSDSLQRIGDLIEMLQSEISDPTRRKLSWVLSVVIDRATSGSGTRIDVMTQHFSECLNASP